MGPRTSGPDLLATAANCSPENRLEAVALAYVDFAERNMELDRPMVASPVTWRVHANSKRPACRLVAEAGELQRDPPWRCRYTHRMHIHLKTLQLDLRAGVIKYRDAILKDSELLARFEGCMNQLYPTWNLMRYRDQEFWTVWSA